jgi:hypothetical protein
MDFVAHESFLTALSEFFRRAMNGEWMESDTRMVKLPEDRPATFALYLNLVYTGRFVTARKSKEELATLDFDDFDRYVQDEYYDMFDLYVLAEKLQDVKAKNAALAAVIDVSELRASNKAWSVPTFNLASRVYEGTPKGNPARRLITDMCSLLTLAYIFESHKVNTWHNDLEADMVNALDNSRPTKKGWSGNVVARKGAGAYMEEV